MGKLRIVSNGYEPFVDRQEAGRLLGWELYSMRGSGAIVLSPPGGGMIVARQVACALQAELDVVLSQRMRAPGGNGIALGSVPETGSVFLNEVLVEELSVSRDYVAVERELQEKEMLRQVRRLRPAKSKAPIEGRHVILVDDGITSGGTMQAALWAVSQERPRSLTIGIPVGPEEGIAMLADDADETVCLKVPPFLMSVEQFYIRYDQVDEDEVLAILQDPQGVNIRGQNRSTVSPTAGYCFKLAR